MQWPGGVGEKRRARVPADCATNRLASGLVVNAVRRRAGSRRGRIRFRAVYCRVLLPGANKGHGRTKTRAILGKSQRHPTPLNSLIPSGGAVVRTVAGECCAEHGSASSLAREHHEHRSVDEQLRASKWERGATGILTPPVAPCATLARSLRASRKLVRRRLCSSGSCGPSMHARRPSSPSCRVRRASFRRVKFGTVGTHLGLPAASPAALSRVLPT